MSYGDMHRFLLRAVSCRGVMALEDAKTMVEGKSGNEQINIKEMVKEINEVIKPFKQMIKIVHDELKPGELLVFLSLGCDETSRAQNVFKPIELEFFKVLLEEIMTTDVREITDLTAVNLATRVKVGNKYMDLVDAERILKVWCNMGYLEYSDNNYALGVRTIHEFEPYFIENMPDAIKIKCFMCNSTVFRGYNCPHCPKTIHKRCLDINLRIAQKWPCCKYPYNHSELQRLRGQRDSSTSGQLEKAQSMEVAAQSDENTMVVTEGSQEEEVMEAEDIRPRRSKRRMDS